MTIGVVLVTSTGSTSVLATMWGKVINRRDAIPYEEGNILARIRKSEGCRSNPRAWKGFFHVKSPLKFTRTSFKSDFISFEKGAYKKQP